MVIKAQNKSQHLNSEENSVKSKATLLDSYHMYKKKTNEMLTKSKHNIFFKDKKSLILPVKHNGDLDFKTGAMLLILHGEKN